MNRRLLASRIAVAKSAVARVPDRIDAIVDRPPRPPRCLVTTGIGTSEGHARHLAEVAARWAGQPARFASTGSLADGVPDDVDLDWLVVFSQGLSPNARYALRDLERWGAVFLVTGVADSSSDDAPPSSEVEAWLEALDARGVHRVEMGCGPERGLLLRVIGARVGYAVGWSFLRSLAARRLESVDVLDFDARRLLDAQTGASRSATRTFPDDASLLSFFDPDRPLLFVAAGGLLDLAEQLSLKIAEGMLRPQPRCLDVLEFTHGPLQSISSRPASILYLGPESRAEGSESSSADDWSERLAATLDPGLHTLRSLSSRLPAPLSVVEYEAILDEFVLRWVEAKGVNPAQWPGADRESALYDASPPRETRAVGPPHRPATPIRFEEAVWPEVEAWIERGRRTALIALGSIEQHGPHLPLGTDQWIAQALADGLAARVEDAIALPALPLGCASEHLDFAGTLHVEAETLEALLRDVLRSAARHGFERAFVFTAHGGNLDVLESIRASLETSSVDLDIVVATDLPISAMQARMVEAEGLARESAGPHAGEYETSVVAGLRPGSIRRAGLGVGRIVREGDGQSLFYPSLRPNAESGVLGDPTRANASRGRRYLDGWLELLETSYRGAFVEVASDGVSEKNRQ